MGPLSPPGGVVYGHIPLHGVTLGGASMGIKYYLTPQWEKIREAKVGCGCKVSWRDGEGQRGASQPLSAAPPAGMGGCHTLPGLLLAGLHVGWSHHPGF